MKRRRVIGLAAPFIAAGKTLAEAHDRLRLLRSMLQAAQRELALVIGRQADWEAQYLRFRQRRFLLLARQLVGATASFGASAAERVRVTGELTFDLVAA